VTAPYDAIVVGGGHNGLVTAAYLAKAGRRTLVLERREEPGGAAELALTVGRLSPTVVQDLRLAEHGLAFIRPAVRAFAPDGNGGGLTLWADPARTTSELAARSKADAEAYPKFDAKVRAVASFLAHVAATTPPDVRSPSFADAIGGLRLARAFRGLGDRGQTREAIRILPMAVADLVGDAFETDVLRAAIAVRGIRYAAMGPWSAGTAANLLFDSAGNDGGAAGETVFARGGPGAVGRALAGAARAFGAKVRCGATVERVTIAGGRVTGVALAGGEELAAPIVVSGVDPKRVLLGMVDPVAIGPTLVWRAGNLRMPGVVARVELTLDALPVFPGADEERLQGRIVLAPGIDDLERAFDASKYGRVSEEPFLEATIPSLADPTQASNDGHRMLVLVQFAPYHLRDGDWDGERDRLGDRVLATLERFAPGLTARVTEREVLTPLDLERDYGLTEGHPMHGEHGLDQLFAWRPLFGHARYRLPVEGLFLCGSGAHPGGGVTGRPGANAAREILRRRAR
jgi:phytoene dehydrogenase-like protein